MADLSQEEIMRMYGVDPAGPPRSPSEAPAPSQEDIMKMYGVADQPKPKNDLSSLAGWGKAFEKHIYHNIPVEGVQALLDYPAGWARNITRHLTGDHVSQEDWDRAKVGHAPYYSETDRRTDPDSSRLLSLAKDTATNPATWLQMAVSGGAPAALKDLLESGGGSGTWSELAKAAGKDAFTVANEVNPLAIATNPIAYGLRKLGRGTYNLPWKQADNAHLKRTNNARFETETPFSDRMWEHGVGGIGKGIKKTIQEVQGVRRKLWGAVEENTKGLPDADFSPAMTQEANIAAEEAQNAILRQHAKSIEPTPPPPDTMHGYGDTPEPPKATTEVAPPDGDSLKIARENAYDSKVEERTNAIIKEAAKGKYARQRLAQNLITMSPDLEGPIKEAFANMDMKDPGAGDQLKQVLAIAFHGPYKPDELADAVARSGKIAAGGTSHMVPNLYEGGNSSSKQVASAGVQKALHTSVENQVAENAANEGLTTALDNKMGNDVERLQPNADLGEAAKAKFVSDKQRYADVASGYAPAIRVLHRTANRSPLTLPEALAGGFGGLGKFALIKGGEMVMRGAGVPMSLGRGIHNMGKTTAWDALARQAAQEFQRKNEDEKD